MAEAPAAQEEPDQAATTTSEPPAETPSEAALSVPGPPAKEPDEDAEADTQGEPDHALAGIPSKDLATKAEPLSQPLDSEEECRILPPSREPEES